MSESAEIRAQHAQRIFEKAVNAHRAGQLDKAIAGYVRTLDIDSDYSQALNNMGVALRAQGAFHAAAASYRRAIALNRTIRAAIPTSATRYALSGAMTQRRRVTVRH